MFLLMDPFLSSLVLCTLSVSGYEFLLLTQKRKIMKKRDFASCLKKIWLFLELFWKRVTDFRLGTVHAMTFYCIININPPFFFWHKKKREKSNLETKATMVSKL